MASPKQNMTQLENVLRRHLNDKADEPALTAVMDVYAFVQAMQSCMAGESTPEVAEMASRSLISMMIGWGANPFMQRHGAAFMAVAAAAIGAIYDGATLRERAEREREKGRDEESRELMFRAAVQLNQIVEVAISAIALQKGMGYARQNAVDVRDAMWAIR
jgi:hypothetical protein